MVHHKLAYLGVAGVLGQVGDISVHIAIYLYALYHLVAVSLEPAVEVVQVLYARYFTCRGVEQLGGQCFAQWVVSFLFVARNKVVPLLGNHSVQDGYFVGAVLQVGIHCYHHVAPGTLEPAIQGRRLAVIAAEFYSVYGGVLLTQALYHVPRIVGTAVVYEDDFIRV